MAQENEPSALREVLEGLALSERIPRGTPGAEHVPSVPDEAHAFWDTQPVPKLGEDTSIIGPSQTGPIDPPDVSVVRKEPYNLPLSFEWSDVDLADNEQAQELYCLLHVQLRSGGSAVHPSRQQSYLHLLGHQSVLVNLSRGPTTWRKKTSRRRFARF